MTLTVETWCEALESGKYRQWRGALRSPGQDDAAFCCLGVACDLSGLGHWEDDTYWIGCKGDTFTIPRYVREQLDLRDSEGEFEFGSLPPDLQAELVAACGVQPYSLANINDHGGSFPLIAKVIRARPKGLFREDAE